MLFIETQHFPHEQALGDSGMKNSLLTGRNVEQTLAHGGWPSASTGWFESEREREREQEMGGRQERKHSIVMGLIAILYIL